MPEDCREEGDILPAFVEKTNGNREYWKYISYLWTLIW